MKQRFFNFALLGLAAVLLLSFIPQSQAQSGLTWTADFFNNETLSGTAVRQTYNNINFNWGNSAPVSGINADHWSARFTTVAPFNAGTYRFSINADDAVRLYVHGQLIIDTWKAPRLGQTLTADMALTAANAGITLDIRDNTNEAYLSLSWQQVSGNPSAPTGAWVGEYWNNQNLSNNPNVVINEASPSHDWGTGAPVNGVGADNWSARWSSSQNYTAGTYRLTLTVDDGARVYVNGSRVIDEWHGSPTIATYVRDVQLFNGLNSFIIEYFEASGVAKIQFSLVPASSVQPTTPPVAGTAQLQINTSRLNVRSTPFVADNIILKVDRGSVYPILGRNAEGTWWFIQVGANTGWVSGAYVITQNAQNVPVMNVTVEVPEAPFGSTGYNLRATANLNIRSGAATSFNRINILPNNTYAAILARNSSNTWWMVSYGGTTGWVSGSFVVLPSNMDYNRIPVR